MPLAMLSCATCIIIFTSFPLFGGGHFLLKYWCGTYVGRGS